MSEYQRYEFMTVDRPLTKAQLNAVNDLSSHIEASSTHALIEYHWSGFRYDPIKVLHQYFDGFLYWANWGSPRLALRFPHVEGDMRALYIAWLAAQSTRRSHTGYRRAANDDDDYDDDEYDEEDEYEEGEEDEEDEEGEEDEEEVDSDSEEKEDYEISIKPVPPGFATLTAAQQALAELLQVSQELLTVAGPY